ncbi:unnamed protein product [Meganyctiphanes norvegica]|uniref:HNH/Endo VII superfamily nuclease toxins domain-containing protein n=1 Tax=Meganyctiphanes norvegica TaxID=48144 RepID=A0AAV2R2W9_MEGNR
MALQGREFETKGAALAAAKSDAKVHKGEPISIWDVTGDHRENPRQLDVLLRDMTTRQTPEDMGLGYTTEEMNVNYYYTTDVMYQAQPFDVNNPVTHNEIVIQHHPTGHTFGDGPADNRPHFHVRPLSGPLGAGGQLQQTGCVMSYHTTCKLDEDGMTYIPFVDLPAEEKCHQHYWYPAA